MRAERPVPECWRFFCSILARSFASWPCPSVAASPEACSRPRPIARYAFLVPVLELTAPRCVPGGPYGCQAGRQVQSSVCSGGRSGPADRQVAGVLAAIVGSPCARPRPALSPRLCHSSPRVAAALHVQAQEPPLVPTRLHTDRRQGAEASSHAVRTCERDSVGLDGPQGPVRRHRRL